MTCWAGEPLSHASDRTADQDVGDNRQCRRNNQQLQHVHATMNDQLVDSVEKNREDEHSSQILPTLPQHIRAIGRVPYGGP
jgi:hypothetical protein